MVSYMIAINEIPISDYSYEYIEFDDYVPLRCKSYAGTLGVKYLRLGNFETSLLELQLDPAEFSIRGFTLTAFDTLHAPKEFKELPVLHGLPVVRLDENKKFQGPRFAQRMDIPENFSVGFGEDFLEIQLGLKEEPDKLIKSGSVEFCIYSGMLICIRILGLTSNQLMQIKEKKSK